MENPRETFFTEVSGSRVSDHYARNIYVKLFRGSYSHQKYFPRTLGNLFENTYNMYGAGIQPETYFTRSFIF